MNDPANKSTIVDYEITLPSRFLSFFHSKAERTDISSKTFHQPFLCGKEKI